MKPQPESVVDSQGNRRAVLLSLDEYRRLLYALEDQLDAADLDEAAQSETDFAPYDRVRDALRAESVK